MLGKLLYGQFSLKETFWKFGVLGIFFNALVLKIIKAFLAQPLHNMSITQYYLHYFSLLKMDGGILFFTLMYLLFAFILCAYSIIVLFGVWRSAANYDKSIWMRHIAKVMIILVIYIGLKIGL